ncbi:hypothetical protein GQ42DRAFT_49148 [Ramicandelaber brevisporus]|nr:hypothetical protein GQ42DRAFT_49148 [Ramicandelaber brevisporus]
MNFGYNHAPTPIYTDTECNKGIDAEAKHGADPDKHYMLVVGEGYEDGIDYWYLKNSWGVQWGEAGYMRMVKGRNLCGIANEATIPYLIK